MDANLKNLIAQRRIIKNIMKNTVHLTQPEVVEFIKELIEEIKSIPAFTNPNL